MASVVMNTQYRCLICQLVTYDGVHCLLLSRGYVCFVFTDSIIWHNVVRLGRPILLDASYFGIQSRYAGCTVRTSFN